MVETENSSSDKLQKLVDQQLELNYLATSYATIGEVIPKELEQKHLALKTEIALILQTMKNSPKT